MQPDTNNIQSATSPPSGHLFRLCLWVGLFFLSTSTAFASWNVELLDKPHMPGKLIAVDKQKQTLHVLAKQSPLAVANSYTCTTGQITGDKFAVNDRRTPEGVYFVVNKLDRGLDFSEYGGIAYTLNYPNPVDKMLGKTGYGIWIHSRGRAITPLETRGCIAVNLDDIAPLGKELAPGTAVVVANTIVSDLPAAIPSAHNETAVLLEKKTREWNNAWADRSGKLFDFYDAEAYSAAMDEPFAAFRSQKERLFTSLPWIHITHRSVHVLEGPDYWVTWFEQYYRAPNLSTEGVRRLYWRPNSKGELVIVGMEWLPQDLGMQSRYLETITPGVADFVAKWRAAWLSGKAEDYAAFYGPGANVNGGIGPQAIAKIKKDMWKRARPAEIQLSGIRVMVSDGGVSVDMSQLYRDSSGYSDKGVKILTLHPRGDSWVIAKEEWKKAQ